MELQVNLIAVLVAAIANMALGFLWYSPAMFAKKWMQLTGINPNSADKAGMFRGIAIGLAASLLMAYILAHFVEIVTIANGGAMNVAGAITLAGWLWLGFVATTLLDFVAWEKRPWALFGINGGYRLAAMVVMAAILAWWPW